LFSTVSGIFVLKTFVVIYEDILVFIGRDVSLTGAGDRNMVEVGVIIEGERSVAGIVIRDLLTTC